MNNFSLRHATSGLVCLLLLFGLSGCTIPNPFNDKEQPAPILPPYPIPALEPTTAVVPTPAPSPAIKEQRAKAKSASRPPPSAAPSKKASIARANQLLKQGKKNAAADMYFRSAFNFQSPQRERIILQAAELTASQGEKNKTNAYLKRIDRNRLSRENQVRYRYIQSLLALHIKNPRLALQLTPEDPTALSPGLRKKVSLVRQRAREMQMTGHRTLRQPAPPRNTQQAALPPDTIQRNTQPDTTQIPPQARINPGSYTGNPPAAVINTVNKVAVLLPQSGSLATVAQEIFQGIQDQKSQAGTEARTQLYPVTRNNIVAQYTQAVNEGADVVIGPLSKESLSTLLAQPAVLSKPLLSLNYLTNQQSTPGTLYQFGLSPDDEARQIARFAMANNQTSATLLTPDSLWGKRIASLFTQHYQQQGGQIIHAATYSNRQPAQYLSIIRNALAQSRGTQMVFLAASPTQARLLKPLLQGQASSLPVYATSHIFSGRPNPQENVDLDGIIYTEIPLILDASQTNRVTALKYPRLYALGADALLIAKNFAALSQNNATLSGKTGQIRLDNNRSIRRRLNFATFINGVHTPLGR